MKFIRRLLRSKNRSGVDHVSVNYMKPAGVDSRCRCGGVREELRDDGVLLLKCSRCGSIRLKPGAIYNTDDVKRIAARYTTFEP